MGAEYGGEFTDFPQGFISEACVLPADFCMLGLSRFKHEVNHEFRGHLEEIELSLQRKCEELGTELVMPTEL